MSTKVLIFINSMTSVTCPHFNSALRQIRYTWIHLHRGLSNLHTLRVTYAWRWHLLSSTYLHYCIFLSDVHDKFPFPQIHNSYIDESGLSVLVMHSEHNMQFMNSILVAWLWSRICTNNLSDALTLVGLHVCLWNLDPFVRWRLAQDSFRWIAKRHPFIHVHSCMVVRSE